MNSPKMKLKTGKRIKSLRIFLKYNISALKTTMKP